MIEVQHGQRNAARVAASSCLPFLHDHEELDPALVSTSEMKGLPCTFFVEFLHPFYAGYEAWWLRKADREIQFLIQLLCGLY